jgi:hypothetical protein
VLVTAVVVSYLRYGISNTGVSSLSLLDRAGLTVKLISERVFFESVFGQTARMRLLQSGHAAYMDLFGALVWISIAASAVWLHTRKLMNWRFFLLCGFMISSLTFI